MSQAREARWERKPHDVDLQPVKCPGVGGEWVWTDLLFPLNVGSSSEILYTSLINYNLCLFHITVKPKACNTPRGHEELVVMTEWPY